MSLTPQKIVNKARRDLHDEIATFRWSDIVMVGYINDAQHDLRMKRPEYWMDSNLDTQALVEASASSMTADLLLPDEILENISAYVSSNCLSEDNSDTENLQRASNFLAKYQKITG